MTPARRGPPLLGPRPATGGVITPEDIATREAVTAAIIEEIVVQGQATPANPMLPEDIADRQAERELRLRYARWWIYILVVQLVVMNVVFVLVGAGGLVFPGEWSLNIFMAGTLAEVFLVVREIVKYLFPSPC